MTRWALVAYSIGLVGLILVKVLAPGFYARQNIKTPVKIAIVTLIATQAMNLAFIGPAARRAGAVDRPGRLPQRRHPVLQAAPACHLPAPARLGLPSRRLQTPRRRISKPSPVCQSSPQSLKWLPNS
jgi:hypothetical protein